MDLTLKDLTDYEVREALDKLKGSDSNGNDTDNNGDDSAPIIPTISEALFIIDKELHRLRKLYGRRTNITITGHKGTFVMETNPYTSAAKKKGVFITQEYSSLIDAYTELVRELPRLK